MLIYKVKLRIRINLKPQIYFDLEWLMYGEMIPEGVTVGLTLGLEQGLETWLLALGS